jgi:hypothetical protein
MANDTDPNKKKTPSIVIGPVISTLEVGDTAKLDTVYRRSWYRPFYFSNDPSAALSGEIYKYTNKYEGQQYIHTINATPIKSASSPYPFFATKLDPARPDRLVSASAVRLGDTDILLRDADPTGGGEKDVVRSETTDDTGLSIDDVTDGTEQSGSGASGKEKKYGKNSPGTGKFDPNRPISPDGDSSYDKEREFSERGDGGEGAGSGEQNEKVEGTGSNPFYNKAGFILIPSWLQWITWPLAILADAIFDGFGLSSGFKNILLIIIIGLVIFVIYKYTSDKKKNASAATDVNPKENANIRFGDASASISPEVARAVTLGLI